METQEDTPSPSPAAKLVDDMGQRLFEILAQAQEQFRSTGLAYSEKLHQFFVDLGSEPAKVENDEEQEETSVANAA